MRREDGQNQKLGDGVDCCTRFDAMFDGSSPPSLLLLMPGQSANSKKARV